MTRGLPAILAGLLLLPVATERVAAQASPLTFFKNYFITGDYVVGGTSLWRAGSYGRARKTIGISGVPRGTDILAAFLYVQTAESVQWSGIDHASFNGNDLGPGPESMAKALNWERATQPCWSVAWPGGRRLVTYRADVLRFLPLGPDGKFAVNGSHEVIVPDGGTAMPDIDELIAEGNPPNPAPRAIGASLVVVYRDPSKPFRAVVIYDGGATKSAFASMTQVLGGFYQASGTPAARMTHIVGDGRPYFSERVSVNGQLIATNPYGSALGAKWDNPTFTNVPVAPGAGTLSVEISPHTLLSDCVSPSAMVMSVNVQDSDEDGLLDVWESAATPLKDPAGRVLPDLRAMGADPQHKDLFLEIGYMTSAAASYGGVAKPQHSHLPSHEAIKLLGDTLRDGPTGLDIALHVDVGNGYPPGVGDPYIIRGAGLARGGEAIDEQRTVCAPGAADAPWVCQFAAYPGTVGWKAGYRFLRDEVLTVTGPSGAVVPPNEDLCDTPGYTCTRRFDQNRAQTFRYALFAHAIGLPKSELPCLDVTGAPVADVNDRCTVAPNPAFHTPRTNTGIGDFPGADALITLGAFDDTNGLPVGTPFMQASTLLHELGHTFERRHGGEAFEPNCKPTYLSVMNYLYQLRGLLDDRGTPHLDFSPNVNASLTETALADAPILGLLYRVGWYAPLATSYLNTSGVAAARHCDGSDLLPTDVPMVRVDARTAAATFDWNANNVLDPINSLDINFNGRLDGVSAGGLRGSDDWSNLRLNQLGSRRNVGGLFVYARDAGGTPTSFAVGPLSVDVGKGDLGKGDLGKGDLGKGDLGKGDLGKGDLGKGDLGKGDLGKGDLGKGDLGGGDLFDRDPNNPSGELDFETATGLAKTPPIEFEACVLGVDCASGTTPLHRVRVGWSAPNVGGVKVYTVYRVPGTGPAPGQPWTAVGTVSPAAFAGTTVYSFIDTSTLVNGAQYTYFVVATYLDDTRSDPSNLVTVTAVNDAPVAVNDSYTMDQGTVLTVPVPGVLGNDSDVESAVSAVLGTGPANGTLALKANGSFTYTPSPAFSGTDTFTYRATDGAVSSALATVTIAVRPVGYGLVNVRNLPPATGTVFKPSKYGTLVDFKWKFTKNGSVVASSDAQPSVTITGPGSYNQTFTPANCGQFGFAFGYDSSAKTWSFDWKPKNAAVGTYSVVVRSGKTSQSFPATSGFPVVFVR